MSGRYTYKTNKGAALLFNIVFLVLCIASVAAYFMFPLWKAEVSYEMTAEQIKEILAESDEVSEEIADELAGKTLTVTLGLTLQTSSFVSSYSQSGKEIIDELIDDNVDSLVENLSAFVEEMMPVAVKAAAKKEARDALKEATGSDEFKDPENVDAQLDKVVDALSEENATVTSVTDAAMEAIENIYVTESGGLPMTEAQKAQCRENLQNSLKQMADEDGNISMSDLTAKIILQALNSVTEKTPDDQPLPDTDGNTQNRGGVKIFPVSVFANAETSGEESTDGEESGSKDTSGGGASIDKEELKESLKAQIGDVFDESAMNVVAIIMKAVGGVLIFTFFTWAWVAFKILLRLTSENPTVKLWLPIWLGWLPCLILYIAPKLAMLALNKSADATLAGLTISVASCSVVSLIAAIAMIVLSFPYHALKKRVRDED